MAFADPQSVTINAVAVSMPRVGSNSPGTGTYQSADGLVKETISHSSAKQRTRRVLRLDHSKIAADPFVSGQNNRYSMSAYLVVDIPNTGYTVTEQKQVIDGLTAYLTASTGARVTQLLGGEI